MAAFIVNGGITVILLLMTYGLSSEGLWGAALMFFNVLFSGMIAFNFYEPLAAMLAGSVPQLSGYADTTCLMGLFLVSLVLLRLTTETLAPAMVRFPSWLYNLGRLIFGFGASAIAVAILILAFETSPVHKKVFGAISYDFKPPFNLGLGRLWLSLFQYATATVFADYRLQTRDSLYGTNAKIFDPRGEWLIVHQNARPYGDEFVPPSEEAVEKAPAGGAPGAPGAPPVADAQPPGKPGMGIPGGTAGAAVGLAPGVGP